MLKVAVLVSGGGTNLQAILDNIDKGIIKNTRIEIVISNKKDAYALERARKAGIPVTVISPKDYRNRDEFSRQLLYEIKKYEADLIVLAGYLVIIR